MKIEFLSRLAAFDHKRSNYRPIFGTGPRTLRYYRTYFLPFFITIKIATFWYVTPFSLIDL